MPLMEAMFMFTEYNVKNTSFHSLQQLVTSIQGVSKFPLQALRICRGDQDD